jgi:uncharacterized membrane protein YedE/YeeE
LVFVLGLLFALGLGISGMTQPAKITDFLDFTGAWDPSLAFVMMGAVGTYLLLYRRIVARGAPLFGSTFALPEKRAIDGKLLWGAALFGVGWALSGYCPGPALTAAGGGRRSAILVAIAMAVGIALYEALRFAKKRMTRAQTA